MTQTDRQRDSEIDLQSCLHGRYQLCSPQTPAQTTATYWHHQHWNWVTRSLRSDRSPRILSVQIAFQDPGWLMISRTRRHGIYVGPSVCKLGKVADFCGRSISMQQLLHKFNFAWNNYFIKIFNACWQQSVKPENKLMHFCSKQDMIYCCLYSRPSFYQELVYSTNFLNAWPVPGTEHLCGTRLLPKVLRAHRHTVKNW